MGCVQTRNKITAETSCFNCRKSINLKDSNKENIKNGKEDSSDGKENNPKTNKNKQEKDKVENLKSLTSFKKFEEDNKKTKDIMAEMKESLLLQPTIKGKNEKVEEQQSKKKIKKKYTKFPNQILDVDISDEEEKKDGTKLNSNNLSKRNINSMKEEKTENKARGDFDDDDELEMNKELENLTNKIELEEAELDLCLEKSIMFDLEREDEINKMEKEKRNSMNLLRGNTKLRYCFTKQFKKGKNLKENHGYDYLPKKIELHDREMIKAAFNRHFIFKEFSSDILDSMLATVQLVSVDKDITIYRESDDGSLFYILKEGSIEETKRKDDNTYNLNKYHTNSTMQLMNASSSQLKEKEREKDRSSKIHSRLITIGEIFGEVALLQKSKRNSTAKALEDSLLLVFDRIMIYKTLKNTGKKEIKERASFLYNIPLFHGFSDIDINAIGSKMIKFSHSTNEKIQDELHDTIYIIKEGSYDCFLDASENEKKDSGKLTTLRTSDTFGEINVLYDCNIKFKLISKSESIGYQISKNLLIETFGQFYKDIFNSSIIKSAFFQSALFKNNIIYEVISGLHKFFEVKKLFQNDVFIKENNTYNGNISIVVYGELSGENSSVSVNQIGKIFDEESMYKSEIYCENIISKSHITVILESRWSKIQEAVKMSMNPEKLKELFYQLYLLKSINIFSSLPESTLLDLCPALHYETFIENSFVFKEGSEEQKLYLISNGKAKIYKKGEYIRTLQELNYFGELSLLFNQQRSADVVAGENLCCYTLKKENFFYKVDKNIIEMLKKRISLMDVNDMKLNSIFYIKDLSRIKYGNRLMVHNGKNIYSMKVIKIKKIETNEYIVNYILNERRILLSLDNHFLLKLVKTFKNKSYLFFLKEYVEGIQFSKFLSNIKDNNVELSCKSMKFFLATIIIMIETLHKNMICHRNLTPHNLTLETDGYLKLTEFGTSKELKDGFTYTITGTPHYIAPEVIMAKGYGFSCDYWSLGVITYELAYRKYPFGHNSKDPLEIYREILSSKPMFLDIKSVNSKNEEKYFFQQFIEKLFHKQPKKRLCNTSEIKAEKIFLNFDFNEVSNKKFKPEYFPKTEKEFYNSYIKDLKNPVLDILDELMNKYESKDFSENENEEEEEVDSQLLAKLDDF